MNKTHGNSKSVFQSHEARLERIAGFCAFELFVDEVDFDLSELSDDEWAVIDSIDITKSIEHALMVNKISPDTPSVFAFTP